MDIKVKNKRGIRIQNRIIVSALLLLIQFLLLFFTLFTLSNKFFAVYAISEVLGVITVLFIVNRRGNPSYKITWIIFILLFPVFGIVMFLLCGGGRVMPHLKRKMRECESHYVSLLDDDCYIHKKLRCDDYPHSRQADYLTNESGYPLYSGNKIEYLSPGERFLPVFLEELKKAQKYIFLEFFIVAEGVMWNEVSKILKEKAKSGVEIRVLFDDFGSIKRQHKDFIVKLQSCGIKVAVFNKIKPSFNIFMNNRNHRKIVVIDGKTAITGGLNIADEYINAIKRFGYWLDCAAIIRGSAVKSFLAMFCSTWEFTTGERTDMLSLIADDSVALGNSYALPYCDDPLGDNNPAQGIYMKMINTAQRYIYITSPYLIIDSTMINILQMAAKSGIDVRIVTPHIPDKVYVHPVTQYNYLELLKAGVRIYEYTPGFIHSKLFVSDDKVATVGTVNMDYRSFALHFECGVWIQGEEPVKEIKEDIDRILEQSQEIKLEEWKNSPKFLRFKRATLHLFAPFM